MSGPYVFQAGQGDPNLAETWTQRGMPSDPAHELEGLLDRVAADLARDYEQIRARTRDDPGTAGDQSEQTWAELLRRWLPPGLAIGTKGRILSIDGRASSQVDVVILNGSYPRALAERKIYMAAGVLAAFECKLTLRPANLRSAVSRGRELKRLLGRNPRVQNLRDDLIPPFAFGVLAHAAEGLDSARIDRELQSHLALVDEPRECIDVLSIANIGTWSATRLLVLPNGSRGDVWPATQELFGVGPEGGVHATFARWSSDLGYGPANPIYALIGFMLRRFVAAMPDSAPLAHYWNAARVRGNVLAAPRGRSWPLSILSPLVAAGIDRGLVSTEPDHPWRPIIY